MRGALTPILVSIFTDCSILADWEGRAPVLGQAQPSAPCPMSVSAPVFRNWVPPHRTWSPSPVVWVLSKSAHWTNKGSGIIQFAFLHLFILGIITSLAALNFFSRFIAQCLTPVHRPHQNCTGKGLAALRPNHSHLSWYSLADSEKRAGVWLWMFPEKDHYYHHLYFMFKYW